MLLPMPLFSFNVKEVNLPTAQRSEDLKVSEHLGGKVVYERHNCRQNSAVNSIELCQVGIEHRHKVQLEELCCEFR
jgi:hypothetical protein